MKNQTEIERWNGVVGERWVTHQEALDARIRIYGEQVLARAGLRSGMRVLDVGAGCGDTTLAAARAVGESGKVVGLDISRQMLERARVRASKLSNVELVEHDAATFIADAPFDAIVSRFGVMFFDDPAGAFANLHGAAAPGGSLTFACWQSLADNPWAAVPLSVVQQALPGPPPPPDAHAPGPWALADVERVRAILTRAGWHDVTFTPFMHAMELGTTLDESLEYASRIGPSARLLREADEPTQGRALDALRAALAPLAPTFTLASAVWIVAAKR